MKTKYYVIAALSAAFIISGCSEKDDSNNTVPQKKGDDLVCVIPQTKTALDASLNVVWTNGDKIKVFSESTPAGADYSTTSDNTNTGVFTAVGSAVDGATRYAVYPASAVSGQSLASGKVTMDFSSLAAQSYSAALGTTTVVSATPMVSTSTTGNFTFTNVCGGIKLQLADYAQQGIKIKSLKVKANGGEQIAGTASVDLSTGAVTLNSGTGKDALTVDCGIEGQSIAGTTAAPVGFVVFIPAGTYATGFTFELTDTQGRVYSVAANTSMTIAQGTVTPLKALPLTLYYGANNCYLAAPAAGTVDVDITPYYSFSRTYQAENKSVANPVAATKTAILWQYGTIGGSDNNIVSGATVSGNKMTVTLTGTAGNALVAIEDASSSVLWSYHIWVSAAGDQAYNNTTKGDFTMLDMPLGAISKTAKDQNAYGGFYQWGRKDPFPRAVAYARPTTSPYKTTGVEFVTPVLSDAATGTIANSVKNPTVRLLSAGDWLQTSDDALWGNGTVKTVYDPCPKGYKIADEGCYKDFVFTSKAECDSNYGLLFAINGTTTAYYPTSGDLLANFEGAEFSEYRGYVWTGEPSTYLSYNNASSGLAVKNTGKVRANGQAVRCIKQ